MHIFANNLTMRTDLEIFLEKRVVLQKHIISVKFVLSNVAKVKLNSK